MKERHPWGRLAPLVCTLWILPLVAAAATPPAGSEKAAYQRIKQAFDDTGIHFAHRQVAVFVPPGTMGPAAAAAAAAAVATEPRAESAS